MKIISSNLPLILLFIAVITVSADEKVEQKDEEGKPRRKLKKNMGYSYSKENYGFYGGKRDDYDFYDFYDRKKPDIYRGGFYDFKPIQKKPIINGKKGLIFVIPSQPKPTPTPPVAPPVNENAPSNVPSESPPPSVSSSPSNVPTETQPTESPTRSFKFVPIKVGKRQRKGFYGGKRGDFYGGGKKGGYGGYQAFKFAPQQLPKYVHPGAYDGPPAYQKTKPAPYHSVYQTKPVAYHPGGGYGGGYGKKDSYYFTKFIKPISPKNKFFAPQHPPQVAQPTIGEAPFPQPTYVKPQIIKKIVQPVGGYYGKRGDFYDSDGYYHPRVVTKPIQKTFAFDKRYYYGGGKRQRRTAENLEHEQEGADFEKVVVENAMAEAQETNESMEEGREMQGNQENEQGQRKLPMYNFYSNQVEETERPDGEAKTNVMIPQREEQSDSTIISTPLDEVSSSTTVLQEETLSS